MVKRSDGTESPILEQEIGDAQLPKQVVKYGELVILGYNGILPNGDRGRKRSKFVLYQRPVANGVKRSKNYLVKTPHASQAILNTNQHSISYTLSRHQAVIVEYTHDDDTDMFQIGRSSEAPIDFVVMDTVPGTKNNENRAASAQNSSTISRFSCRILANRKNPNICKVYAAGFDTSKNIFLGEKATKWEENSEMDGLTTNGVLIMNLNGPFCGGASTCNAWCETSVCGSIYSLRESRSAQQKGVLVEHETNSLLDGTLIDLCGATLLWRSAEGLAISPNKRDLERELDEINAGRPQCPVGLNTLVIPRKVTGVDNNQQQPYVYLNCGHVQGFHDWGQDKDTDTKRCPICLMVGPVVKVCMGLEPAFYVDSGPPSFAFNPCGHMATEKTVKFWASVDVPHGTNGFHAICPFCASPLTGVPGYVRLIFQDNVD